MPVHGGALPVASQALVDRGPPLKRFLLVTFVALLAVAGCTRGGEPEATPATSPPTPTAAPSPTTGPVEGQANVVVVAADPNNLVFNDRATPEPDQAAIDAFAGQVTGWLDEHLTSLQDGGEGGLEAVAAPGLLDGTDPEVLEAVTTDLTSPDSPVNDARYHLVVAHSGAPLWARAHVTVTTRDGTAREVGFVLTPSDGDVPTLIAAGQGPL